MFLKGSEKCAVCSSPVSPPGMARLGDRSMLCSGCKALCSPFLKGYRELTATEVKSHIAFMRENRRIFESAFSDGSDVITISSAGCTVKFNDELSLFAVITTYDRCEVFPYSAIIGYSYKAVEEYGSSGARYASDAGVRIKLDSQWHSSIFISMYTGSSDPAASETLARRQSIRLMMHLEAITDIGYTMPPPIHRSAARRTVKGVRIKT